MNPKVQLHCRNGRTRRLNHLNVPYWFQNKKDVAHYHFVQPTQKSREYHLSHLIMEKEKRCLTLEAAQYELSERQPFMRYGMTFCTLLL